MKVRLQNKHGGIHSILCCMHRVTFGTLLVHAMPPCVQSAGTCCFSTDWCQQFQLRVVVLGAELEPVTGFETSLQPTAQHLKATRTIHQFHSA